ncbi:hypothetical protein [Massilia sp. S19_KUP03_FR1]|uniref:hypothetical protein n=1 Tax=Massilia sp. S19_KUP03_FR1 TaxID=3025503 RepID=UPI002FCDCA55
MRRLLVLLAVVAPCALAQTVIVKSTRDPVDKSYRKMVKGMERFAREHALAPQAELRFRLLPRLPNADMRDITLRIAGDTASQPLPVAPDNSFALVRNEQLLREDAAVLANRRTASMTWRASIVSPGLPEGTRRLGDLRLECKVGMDAGLISNTSPMFAWLSDALTSTDAVCGQPDGNYVFFAERPILGITLRAGARMEALPFKMLYAGGGKTAAELPYCDCQVLLDRSYYAPIWDASWPDDTLVEFDYMQEAAP